MYVCVFVCEYIGVVPCDVFNYDCASIQMAYVPSGTHLVPLVQSLASHSIIGQQVKLAGAKAGVMGGCPPGG